MKTTLRRAMLVAAAAASTMGALQVQAQQRTASEAQVIPADPKRPADPAANLPSDTGAQATLPTGAVTGAGQPQGTGRQQDVGSPGGLEPKARQAAREGSKEADKDARGATGAQGSGTARGATPAK